MIKLIYFKKRLLQKDQIIQEWVQDGRQGEELHVEEVEVQEEE